MSPRARADSTAVAKPTTRRHAYFAPLPISAFGEGFASPTGPVVPRRPAPRSVAGVGSLGRGLVETQVDHGRQPTGDASDIRQDRRGGRESFGLGAETDHTVGFVGQQNTIGPRSPSASAGGGRPPLVRRGTVAVELGHSPELHSDRQRLSHDYERMFPAVRLSTTGPRGTRWRTTTTTEEASTTTEPQASDDSQQAAFTIVESVVLHATDLTDRLLQDPSLADDEDGADVERLRELYTEDSPDPARCLSFECRMAGLDREQ